MSNNNIVIAAANTGTEITNNQPVTQIDQVYKGNLVQYSNGSMVHLSLAIVPIKLIAPRRDDKPAK